MSTRMPTAEDFLAYKGAHCHRLWAEVGSDWTCPSCKRNKFELLRWTTRFPRSPNAFSDWMAGLHKHHDHSVEPWSRQVPRFPQTIVCDQCNAADGAAKRKLKLPARFSYSPLELSWFIVARPHSKHEIIYEAAQSIFEAHVKASNFDPASMR